MQLLLEYPAMVSTLYLALWILGFVCLERVVEPLYGATQQEIKYDLLQFQTMEIISLQDHLTIPCICLEKKATLLYGVTTPERLFGLYQYRIQGKIL